MKICEKFGQGKTVFSFEIFPPKKTSSIETIYETLEQLGGMSPDFISVTYGTGQGKDKYTTVELASLIKNRYGIDSVAHLTCVNSTKEDVSEVLRQLKDNGIENILALRGDINPNVEPKKDFKYSCDLVKYIRKEYDFGLSGACYPEGHIDAANLDEDIEHLKEKVDAGVSHLMSQLFFDNSLFYDYMNKVRKKGINVPVEAGVMPVVNVKQIERMVSMCGASLPQKFVKVMQRFESNPQALRDAGIAYAVDQIVDLISNGVDGIHLYTMNNPYVAGKITESIGSLLKG